MKAKMLKKNYEFKHVLTKGKKHTGKYINAFIIKNNQKNNLLGLAINTKYGNAVQRNKLKRLLRENYKNLENQILTGYSIVFLVKKGVEAKEIDFKKIKKDMYKILNNAKIMVVEEK